MTRLSTTQKALALAAAAFVPRVFFILVAGRNEGIFPGNDATQYDHFARLMMSGWQWFSTPWAFREPLYPAFMALAYATPGPEFGVLQAYQSVLGASAPVIVYLGFRRLAGERVSLLAALLVLLNPHFVGRTAGAFRENLIVPLLAAFLVCFLAALHDDRKKRWFYCALFYVLLVHTDVRFLPLAVTFPLMAVAFHGRWRGALRQSLWVWGFVALLMIPYQIRGYVALDKPVLVTSRALDEWVGLARSLVPGQKDDAPGQTREAWLRAWEEEKRAALPDLSAEDRRLFESGGRPRIGSASVYGTLLLEYWRFARSEPMYRPYPDGRLAGRWSLRHTVSSTIVVVPFLLLLPLLFRVVHPAMQRLAYPLLIFLAAHMTLHVFVHAIERYRIPMEIVMAVVAAMVLADIVSRLRGQGRLAPPAQPS